MPLIQTKPFFASASSGGSTLAIFAAGLTTGYAFSYSSDKYNFADETMALSSSTLDGYHFERDGFSNDTTGIIVFIDGNSWTRKYDYASDVYSTGTTPVSSIPSNNGAFSNITSGFMIGGASDGLGKITRYDYAGESWAVDNSLNTPVNNVGTFGSTTIGYVTGGNQYTAQPTYKYTYSTNLVSTGTSLTDGAMSGTACSNNEKGIIAVAYSQTLANTATKVYTFAGDTVANSVSLGLGAVGSMSASSSTNGLIAGGNSSGTSYTNNYVYSSNSISQGTSLNVVRFDGSGFSNCHGGLA